MTRINCVPVQELTNPHLLAEYRELPRIFRLARLCPEAPTAYTLGRGHVKFFYDKLKYLLERQGQIVAEMKRRGMKPAFDPATLETQHRSAEKESLWNGWTPTPEALEINRKRIAERIDAARAKRKDRKG